MIARPHPAKSRVWRVPAGAPLLPAIVSSVVACLLFLPALGFDFVRDDRELLLDGSLLRAPREKTARV